MPGGENRVCQRIDLGSERVRNNVYIPTLNNISARGNSSLTQRVGPGNEHDVIEVIPPRPKSGAGRKKLSFQADFPVSIKQKISKKGETLVPHTEKTDKGYEVEIEYQLGQGADTTIILEIEYKNTPQGKKDLLGLHELKITIDKEILSCKQKLEKFKEEVNYNSYEQEQLQNQLAAVEKKKVDLANEFQHIQETLKSKREFYVSVHKICGILNLSQTNNTIQDFVNCFESSNTTDLQIVQSQTSTFQTPTSVSSTPLYSTSTLAEDSPLLTTSQAIAMGTINTQSHNPSENVIDTNLTIKSQFSITQTSVQPSEQRWSSAPHSTLYGNSHLLTTSQEITLGKNNIQNQNSSENVTNTNLKM